MTFRKEKEIQGHSGAIYSCAFDQSYVYSGSADKFVARWLLDEGTQDKFAIRFEQAVYRILIVDHFLIVGRSDGGLHVFDLEARKELKYFTQHTKALFGLASNPIRKHCYAGDADGNLSVWSTETWELLIYFPLDCGKIRDIAVDSSGAHFAVCGQDGFVRIFETSYFNEISTFFAHKDGATAACFGENPEELITGGKDAMLRRWNWKTGEKLLEIPAHNFAIYRLIRVGDSLVSISRDKTVKVWSESLQFRQRLDQKAGGHRHSVNDCVALSSTKFVTCGDDKRMIVWTSEED